MDTVGSMNKRNCSGVVIFNLQSSADLMTLKIFRTLANRNLEK
jgi:hypothetical protein